MTSQRIMMERSIVRLSKPPRRWKAPKRSILNQPPTVVLMGKKDSNGWRKNGSNKNETEKGLSVEKFVLSTILDELNGQSSGAGVRWRGGHLENHPIVMLFHLLTWDALWCGPIPGGQQQQHSDTPPGLLECQLSSIQLENIVSISTCIDSAGGRGVELEVVVRSILEHVWSKFQGVQHRGVSWSRFSVSEMIDIAVGLGSKFLSAMVKTMSGNYSCWVGGVPDLMLWKVSTQREDTNRNIWETRLIEVKGPQDSLSDTQRAWLHLFLEHNVNVEVVHVTAV